MSRLSALDALRDARYAAADRAEARHASDVPPKFDGEWQPSDFDVWARRLLLDDGWVCCCEAEEWQPSGTWVRFNPVAPHPRKYGKWMRRDRALDEAEPVRTGKLLP